MNDNKDQLKKISSLFNTDKILTTDDVEQVLGGLIKVLANNKKSVEDTSAQHQQQMNDLFEKVAEAQYQLQQQVGSHVDNTKNEISKSVEDRVNKALAEVKSLLEEVRTLMPENGKDADEESIIQSVLDQIKLPESKEMMLDTAEQIRDKLSSLKGKDRLDVKAIKGLDKFMEQWGNAMRNDVTYQSVGRVIGGGNFTAGANITISPSGVISATSSGGGGGYVVETPTGTVDGSNVTFTVTTTPVYIVSDGTTYFENKGYTLAGLTVTMLVPPLDFIRSFHA